MAVGIDETDRIAAHPHGLAGSFDRLRPKAALTAKQAIHDIPSAPQSLAAQSARKGPIGLDHNAALFVGQCAPKNVTERLRMRRADKADAKGKRQSKGFFSCHINTPQTIPGDDCDQNGGRQARNAAIKARRKWRNGAAQSTRAARRGNAKAHTLRSRGNANMADRRRCSWPAGCAGPMPCVLLSLSLVSGNEKSNCSSAKQRQLRQSFDLLANSASKRARTGGILR